MRSVRFICRLALPAAILLGAINAAGAQVGADVQQACTPDAMRLCSQFIPDRAQVERCMASKRRYWSTECRAAAGASRVAARHGRRGVRHVRHHRRHR